MSNLILKIIRLMRGMMAAACSLTLCAFANAQSYPAKPVRLIVGFAAGGLVDTLARTMQPKLQSSLGQPLLIENQAGGAGTVAEAAVAKSAPDGYTLMMSADSPPTNVHLFRNQGYDLFRDLRAVAMLTRVPLVMLVHPSVPATTVQEFMAFARAKSGAVNYASPGAGTANHLYMEILKGIGGFEMTHVAYKGGGPAMNDLLGGQVQAILISITLGAPQVRAGKLRALSTSGDKRTAQLPQVPSFSEGGIQDFNPQSWSGLFVPTNTPPAIVQRLHDEFSQALKDADVAKRLQDLSAEPVMNSPDQFAAFLKTESERLGKLIREKNISAN
ncbi:MAG: Bug family tripartite tricarboxylate transporter substrate binding protein [Burkholderiales bacterium]